MVERLFDVLDLNQRLELLFLACSWRAMRAGEAPFRRCCSKQGRNLETPAGHGERRQFIPSFRRYSPGQLYVSSMDGYLSTLGRYLSSFRKSLAEGRRHARKKSLLSKTGARSVKSPNYRNEGMTLVQATCDNLNTKPSFYIGPSLWTIDFYFAS